MAYSSIYRGLMDGWHGDENECHGSCGICDNCEQTFYEKCEEEYQAYRDDNEI